MNPEESPSHLSTTTLIDGAACHRCGGCGVHLDQWNREQGQIPVTRIASVLWQSWLKPLLSVVLASMFCAAGEVTDLIAMLFIMVSFVAGMMICKRLPADFLSTGTRYMAENER